MFVHQGWFSQLNGIDLSGAMAQNTGIAKTMTTFYLKYDFRQFKG
jgi:hypothetical protein